MNKIQDKDEVNRLRSNLQNEVNSAALYRALSKIEKQPKLADVFMRMAKSEERHAAFWQKKLEDAGVHMGKILPDWRSKVLQFLAQRFGANFVLPTVVGLEQQDQFSYDNQPDALAAKLPAAERSHARLLKFIEDQQHTGMQGSMLAQLEGRHRGASGGNALRAAVLGANDGLVSNISLIMGVAGAAPTGHTILLAGVAGLMAGSCSMAMGEWVSVQSARELQQRQLVIEAEELVEAPEEELEELALIYEAKGLPRDKAKTLANQMLSDKDRALDTLAREELGINPQDLGGSPWNAAGTSFLLFMFGAIIPLFPFLFTSGIPAVEFSVGLSGFALFLIGALITLFTGRNILFSGIRQLVFGLVAAGITYGVGHLIGVTIGN